MIAGWLKKLKSQHQHKVVVLMYHRIADLKIDPWELAVKPEYFEQHLQILKKKFNVISASQLIAQLQDKAIISNSVCITFDDAYSDNYLYGKPLLEKYQHPATFFIPTSYIDCKKPFWWDELEKLLLNNQKLPNVLSIQIGKELCNYKIDNKELSPEQLQKQYNWKWPNDPPNQRCKLYLDIWAKLKYQSCEVIESVLEDIRKWAVLAEIDYKTYLPMDTIQLQEIMDHALFDVGIHTVTHLSLSNHTHEIQEREIIESRNDLQSKSSKPVNTIAFPYGDYNDETIAVVKDQKLIAAFTTHSKSVTIYDSPFQLGRFQVRNWNGETFNNKLFYWFKNS